MDIQATISDIRSALTDAFATIDAWFDKGAQLRTYRPNGVGWTIDEVLEHIGLTNHFLLILIEKGTTKALQNSQQLDLQAELSSHVFQRDKLTEIGQHKFFAWVRPEHMEPIGTRPLPQVRRQLKEQVQQCFTSLNKLRNGEGVLYKTTMSVNGLGKINVYEYIYFLAQHGRRHITQMESNEQEYNALTR